MNVIWIFFPLILALCFGDRQSEHLNLLAGKTSLKTLSSSILFASNQRETGRARLPPSRSFGAAAPQELRPPETFVPDPLRVADAQRWCWDGADGGQGVGALHIGLGFAMSPGQMHGELASFAELTLHRHFASQELAQFFDDRQA